MYGPFAGMYDQTVIDFIEGLEENGKAIKMIKNMETERKNKFYIQLSLENPGSGYLFKEDLKRF